MPDADALTVPDGGERGKWRRRYVRAVPVPGRPTDEVKRARVDEPHVAPLNSLVRSWRTADRFVPWFDPDGGGTGAHVLLLMEIPSPATVRAGDLGLSSEDNADPTARALTAARSASGLRREQCLR